jgi:hypothetical protein
MAVGRDHILVPVADLLFTGDTVHERATDKSPNRDAVADSLSAHSRQLAIFPHMTDTPVMHPDSFALLE